jgi:hypothetical protein
MTESQEKTVTTADRRPLVAGTWTLSRLLILLAFVFFVLAALLAGGVITASGLGWLVDAGLASLALAFLVP